MQRWICLCVGFAAFALCSSTGVGTALARGHLVVRPCSGSNGHVLCGSIQVPLYRKAPSLGAPLTVVFRVYKHSNRSRPALEPLVADEGGPGISSTGSASTYLYMMGALHRRHDLIVMDNRGTGLSGAIDCPRLQQQIGDFTAATGACARRLGVAANAYGTGAAADDLKAILDALHISKVDVYGDSYGTYFAQAFAVRHPVKTRAIVLDGAFSLGGFDPWERNELPDLRAAWQAVCARWGSCSGILAELHRLALALDAKPLVGVARDADGAPHHVRVNGAALAQMTVDASSSYAIYRDLAAAGRSYFAGRPAPLLRLAGEDLGELDNGAARWYSVGALQAVTCHDYPTIWNRSARIPARRAQIASARSKLAPNVFAPFTKSDWLQSAYQHQLVYGCLLWPRPPVADPALPKSARIPHVPVLVINGDLDTLTPSSDAARAANLFPNSTYVHVRNSGHVLALADFNGCVSGIVHRFLNTLSAGDTSCASRVQEIHTVPAFPVRLAGVAKPTVKAKAAWVAGEVTADAFARWWLMYGYNGHGLRGGTFTSAGPYLSQRPVTISMRGLKFVSDLAVSGTAVWNRVALTITGRVTLKGAASGRLTVRWPTNVANAKAHITGVVDGQSVDLMTAAP